MPAARKRYDENDKPTPCVVKIPAKLAEFIYRERLDRKYRDETELVVHIVRMWAESLDPVNWKDVLRRLKEEDAEEDDGAGTKAG